MKSNQSFSDQLRSAILNAPVSRYRIAKDLEISESILSRFVHGDCGLSIDYLDRICEYLDLRLVGPARGKQGIKRPRSKTPKAKGE
jgi:hypothetical protein